MPEIEISIGGRFFEVACQEGEEHFLQSAAQLLNTEASVLTKQMGRLSEGRLLLMAGLMLADKTSGIQDQLMELKDKLAAQEALISELRGAANAQSTPSDALGALVARTEAVADTLESAAS